MLRLILLASLSLVPGCSCDALWGSYEVPCTRGFDCPDAAMPGEADLAMSGGEQDLTGSDTDGPHGNGDMGMGAGDMNMLPGFDMAATDMIVSGRLDMDKGTVGGFAN